MSCGEYSTVWYIQPLDYEERFIFCIYLRNLILPNLTIPCYLPMSMFKVVTRRIQVSLHAVEQSFDKGGVTSTALSLSCLSF